MERGGSVERLTTSPHYRLPEHTPEGEEERIKKRRAAGAQKYKESEDSYFYVVSKLTFLLTFGPV